jgi:hypothetical protein
MIYYEIVGTAQITCHFDFKWMPFDWQKCSTKVTTFLENETVVRYETTFSASARAVSQIAVGFTFHKDINNVEWRIIDEGHKEDSLVKFGDSYT